ncbi:MAG TPA: ATP-binding protein [Actinomycetes bacterium]|nr:ATP-binding protein [Actinomycetes bacterium]
MDELLNPFRPGAGAPPPELVGRDRLIDAFGVTLRRAMAGRPGKSLLLVGLRGVGKTVLLNRFAEIAEDEGASVGHIEAGDSADFSAQLAQRLRRILLRFDRHKPSAAVLRGLRALKGFSVHLPDGSAISLDVDALRGVADSGVLADDVVDLFEAVGDAAREVDLSVLIVIDEMQALSQEQVAALVSAVHRSVQRSLPLVLVGAGLPQLPALLAASRSYAERAFDVTEIGRLSDADAAAAIAVPALRQGLAFTDDAIARVVERTSGYPYFLQEWGYHLWNAARRSPVTLADVTAVETEVVADLDRSFFRVRYERLTERERAYALAMAGLGPGAHRSGEVAAALGISVETAAPRRAALIAKGLVHSPARGLTAFTVPMFDSYLRRRITAGDEGQDG